MTLRFDLPAKVILMTGPHPECQRRICTRGGENGKILFNIKKPLPLQGTVLCFQSGQVIAAILSIA